MELLLRDIRFGLRGLIKRPGFTVIALITLALGIGANTAIFSVVNAVLLRPLPFQKPEELVIVWEDATFAGFPHNTPAPANYVDWKAQNQSFADMAASNETSFNLTGDGEPERVASYSVTANFFPLLGVQPLLGRSFLTEEDRPGANKVVVLSYSLWQSRYGGDRNILNRSIPPRICCGGKNTPLPSAPWTNPCLRSRTASSTPARKYSKPRSCWNSGSRSRRCPCFRPLPFHKNGPNCTVAISCSRPTRIIGSTTIQMLSRS